MITLMYHGITSADLKSPFKREAGAELYDVKIEDFRAQMHCLKDSRVRVFLTFDDGEMNNYEAAFPILKELGLNAYFFIITNRIGQSGYMGIKELKIMGESGMIIGSHGFSHEILTQLSDIQIIDELTASKRCLETNLNVPVDAFSVPRGFYNDKIIQMASDAGYTRIFISDRLNGSKSDCTPRIAVKASWSLKRFQQALKGHVPQGERVVHVLKNTAKFVLNESGYNLLRRGLVLIIK